MNQKQHWTRFSRGSRARAVSRGQRASSLPDMTRLMDFWQASRICPARRASRALRAPVRSNRPRPLVMNRARASSQGWRAGSRDRLSGQGRVRQRERETSVGRSCSRWAASRTKQEEGEGSSSALSRALAALLRFCSTPMSSTTRRP